MPLLADRDAGAGDRPARPPGLRPAEGQRPSRRSRSSTARRWAAAWSWRCTATTARCPAARRRSALPEVVARPGARLGRHPAAAEPDRHPGRRPGDHPEPADAEQDAQAEAGRRAGHRGRAAGAGRLPGAVAGVGRRRGPGRGHRRPGPRSTRTCGTGVLYFARQTARRAAARRGPGRVQGARPAGDWPRTRDFAAGTAAEDEALADLVFSEELRSRPVRVRPGAAAGQAAGRRAGQGPGPRRSPRSASSAPA